MGRQFSDKAVDNGKTRSTKTAKLLSTVSGAALLLGVAHATARAGITEPQGAFTGVSSIQTDYIYINTGEGTFDVSSLSNDGSLSSSPISKSVTKSAVADAPQAYMLAATTTGVKNTGAVTLTTTITIDTASEADAKDLGGGGPARGVNITTTGILNAVIHNTTTIDVTATSQASGFNTFADASAQATGIIMVNTMTVVSASGESARFENMGTLNVLARATGTGTAVEHFVNATAMAASMVVAAASTSNTVTAAFTNTVSGDVNVTASANAFVGSATFTDVDATASANVDGFRLNAKGAKTTNSTLTNDGSVDLNSFAIAGIGTSSPATETPASAQAFANMGFAASQKATGTGGTSSVAKADFTNTNSNSFNINITATATGSTFASAVAKVTSDVFLQSVSGAASASAAVANTGKMTANLDANALATDGPAIAKATISESVIDQQATATGGAGSVANAKVTNTDGTILIDLSADALGDGDSTATAKIGNDVVDQVASGEMANVLFSNAKVGTATTATALFSLTLDPNVTAIGIAKGTALASISGDVFDQTATGSGGTSSAKFVNSGTINITLDPDAAIPGEVARQAAASAG